VWTTGLPLDREFRDNASIEEISASKWEILPLPAFQCLTLPSDLSFGFGCFHTYAVMTFFK